MTDNMQYQPTDYGSDHHHKPTKAMIGIAILIVMGFVLYEVNGKTELRSAAPTSQSLAWYNR